MESMLIDQFFMQSRKLTDHFGDQTGPTKLASGASGIN